MKKEANLHYLRTEAQIMNISPSIRYIGVNDHQLDLFEGQYTVPHGMAYNSYLILDEKIAVMDTVDVAFTQAWLDQLESNLEGRKPDYLIIQHMEPDHSASILQFMERYPQTTLAASAKAFSMIKNFFGRDFENQRLILAPGASLSLGVHQLSFITAPMVHWPEVIMTYEQKEGILFSADAFGKFGALDEEEEWLSEARRYYFGIVGKYGAQVQLVLKKAANLDIRKICPLHGPVLSENTEKYLKIYDTWSSYKAEEEGVVIAYTSVYGNTRKAVMELKAQLEEKNIGPVTVYDLARSDMSQAVADAFRYSRLVLATTTYNGDIFPFMREFIQHLTERNFSNRTVAFMENGSWAPMAEKVMKEMLAECKNLSYAENSVKILSAMNEENLARISLLASELSAPCAIKEEAAPEKGSKRFACKICGYVHEADALPEDFRCPLCKRPAAYFEEVKEN